MLRDTTYNRMQLQRAANELAEYRRLQHYRPFASLNADNRTFVQKVLDLNPNVFIDSRELVGLFADAALIDSFTDLCGNFYYNSEISLRATYSHTGGFGGCPAIMFGEGGLTYITTASTNAVLDNASGYEAVFYRNLKPSEAQTRLAQYVSGSNLLAGVPAGGFIANIPNLSKSFGSYGDILGVEKLVIDNTSNILVDTGFNSYTHRKSQLFKNGVEISDYAYQDTLPNTALALIGGFSANPLQNLHYAGATVLIIGFNRPLNTEERAYLQTLITESGL